MTPIERAALMSRLPGVTLAEAAKRFAVTTRALSKARKELRDQPSTADVALAALTRNGELTEGTLGDLARIGEFLDYACKDPRSAAEVRAMLDTFVAHGILEIEGDAWRLLEPWP